MEVVMWCWSSEGVGEVMMDSMSGALQDVVKLVLILLKKHL